MYAVGGGSWGVGAFLANDVPEDEMLDLGKLSEGWTKIPTCPGRRRCNSCATALANKVYVFGGVYAWKEKAAQKVMRLGDAWCFDPDSREWKELAPLPCNGLSGAAALPFGDRHILILGGAIPTSKEGPDGTLIYRDDPRRGVKVGWYNEDIFVYDARKDRYQTADGQLPMGVHDIRAAISGNMIYAIGGENVDPSTSNTCSLVRIGTVEAKA